MRLRQEIPNIISLLNGTSGAIGVYLVSSGTCLSSWLSPVESGIVMMLVSMVLDFFDGFAARKLHATSAIGVDLDSLSDLISFGVLPAVLLMVSSTMSGLLVPWISFLIVPLSALRLARFNHDTRQHHTFVGLPTPAHALLWAGVSALLEQHSTAIAELPRMMLYKLHVLIPLMLIGTCYLLVSQVPMFSLKSGSILRGRWQIITVALASGIGIGLLGLGGLAVGMIAYILCNLLPHLRWGLMGK